MSRESRRGRREKSTVKKTINKKTIVVTLAAVLLTTVYLAAAQQPGKILRLGVLTGGSASSDSTRIQAFVQGLREFGWVEGQNIVIEYPIRRR